MQKAADKLKLIQSDLVAPKNLENKFGNYRYRSAEGILEAVKPLLSAVGAILTVSDEMVEVGGRIYVKATATFTADGESISTTAFAREPESRKGMDESQITGACSSYARKYALNGLFCIDDTKDADATETHGKTDNVTPEKFRKEVKPQGEDMVNKIIDSFKAQTTLEGLEAKREKANNTPYGNDARVNAAYAECATALIK